MVRGHDDGVGARDGVVELERRGRHVRVVDRDVGQLALEQAHELVGQRVALVVGARLEREAEDGDLAPGERPEAPRQALDEEQRDALVDPRDGEQHARGVRALLGEREVLAQARARGEAGLRHAAARVVVVDQLDDVEDVRAVLLAVHHEQVGQGERGVAQDVRPDLRELGLHRRGLHDRRAEDLEQAADDRAGPLADAADDARQRDDLLEEAARGDALGAVGDEELGADVEAAVLGHVARDELGGARRDRRAERQRLARAQVGQQVVEDRADVAQVDLDVAEGRRPERDDDVVGLRRVGDAVGPVHAACAGEDLGRAGLVEGHAPVAHRAEELRGLVDPERRAGRGRRRRAPAAARRGRSPMTATS